jgi:neutral amino acid transport system ATP-binding protein
MRASAHEPLLLVKGLVKHFLGVTALDEVDLAIYPGELVSLIGPNGSGKSTLFNCVTGFIKPDGGQVYYKGEQISGLRPDQIVLKGIARTFQDVRVFGSLTVLENLLLVAQQHQEDNIIKRFLHAPSIRRLEKQSVARAEQLLEMVGLTHLRNTRAGHISYGQRKLLEFAGALIPDPDLIMLDEPAAAVNPTMIGRMKEYIRAQNQAGKTFLVVEHNMDVVMDLSQHIIVLDIGKKIAEGAPAEIQNNISVQEAYFGR